MSSNHLTPQSLKGILPSLIPSHIMPPDNLTYICPNCGRVPPVFFAGRWRRVGCQCERAARLEKEKREQEAKELVRAMQRSFNWLENKPENQRTYCHLSERTFETFDPAKQPQGELTDLAKRARLGCINFAQNILEEDFYGNIILYGLCGTGKSHLLVAICNDLRTHGKIARFAPATEFIGEIQRRRFSDEDAEALLQFAKSAHFLVLDDVDKVPPTDVRISLYDDIMNYRFNHRLPTGITLNHLDLLEKHTSEAAASRLTTGLVAFHLKGADVRKQ